MIKRMGIFQRRSDLTLNQFSAYWGKKHSPLVMAMPKFERYTQNHRMDLLPNFLSEHLGFDIDGIAEMYWQTDAQMQQDFNSQQGMNVLRQDETEFMSHISVCIAEERKLYGTMSAVKLILCLSSINSEINADNFKLILPNVRGIQMSEVKSVIQRPQLPPLLYIPQYFFSLWFDQYIDVITDFESKHWLEFYHQAFVTVDRASLSLVYPFEVRNLQDISILK